MKRAIHVSLNWDVVRQARLHTRNLSGTLEVLLAGPVSRERVRQRQEDAGLDRMIFALDVFPVEHGLLSDEHSAL